MNGTLVDAEGFPRPDVDIYNVRHKRVEVISECYFSFVYDKG